MTIKALEERVKTVIVEQEVDGVIQQIPVEKVIGYNICRIEIDNISTFKEWVNPRTNKPFKGRSLLVVPEGVIMVKHSFNQLQQFKSDLHRRIEIKGFMK